MALVARAMVRRALRLPQHELMKCGVRTTVVAKRRWDSQRLKKSTGHSSSLERSYEAEMNAVEPLSLAYCKNPATLDRNGKIRKLV